MVTAAALAAAILGVAQSFTVSSALAADQPDMALIAKGRHISDTVAGVGCKGCHGAYGEGDVGTGPYARGVDLSKIRSAISGIKQMECLKKELKPADIVVIGNTSTAAQGFSSDKMGLKTFTVPAREAVDMVWNAPETEGSYSLQCPDCMVKDQSLTFVVTKNARRHVNPMATAGARN
ncbi:MAG: hypothetical protein HYU75_16445 [Betaproteobacteria bacterium]|nr:hypothetical protein [Betaproteobacteria bacterium]